MPIFFRMIVSMLIFSIISKSKIIESFLTNLYLLTFGILHQKKIFTYTRQSELNKLLILALTLPENARALEIGSHLGASTIYLAAGLAKKNGRLFCVDTWQNDAMSEGNIDTYASFIKNTSILSNYIEPIRDYSSNFDKSLLDGQLDLVFIDGDHSYESVKNDFLYILPNISDRAIIAFHDSTSRKGVSKFIGELLSSEEWVSCGLVQSLFLLKRAIWTHKFDIN